MGAKNINVVSHKHVDFFFLKAWIYHLQKNKGGHLSYTVYKNLLKWIKGLNIRPKTIKVLEEIIRYSNGFLTLDLRMISWILHQSHRQHEQIETDRMTTNLKTFVHQMI